MVVGVTGMTDIQTTNWAVVIIRAVGVVDITEDPAEAGDTRTTEMRMSKLVCLFLFLIFG